MSAQLVARDLLERAETETGCTDYGDPTLAERFSLVIDHLNGGVGMDADGRQRAAEVCHWLLTSRLQFIADRHRYPVAEEVIEQPMFVTGEPPGRAPR